MSKETPGGMSTWAATRLASQTISILPKDTFRNVTSTCMLDKRYQYDTMKPTVRINRKRKFCGGGIERILEVDTKRTEGGAQCVDFSKRN